MLMVRSWLLSQRGGAKARVCGVVALTALMNCLIALVVTPTSAVADEQLPPGAIYAGTCAAVTLPTVVAHPDWGSQSWLTGIDINWSVWQDVGTCQADGMKLDNS